MAASRPVIELPPQYDPTVVEAPGYQRWLDAQVVIVEKLQKLDNETLIIHGRDDIVVPPEISLNLHRHIRNSQLHMFGNCGHWTQIEHAKRFQTLVANFLDESRA